MMKRRSKLIRDSEPYQCASHADGTITVTPAWPQFSSWTEEDGGGPGRGPRLKLAAQLQAWLNAPYKTG